MSIPDRSLRTRLAAFLAWLLISASAWSAPATPPPFVTDQVVVAFHPGTPAADISAAHQRAGGKLLDTIEGIGVQVVSVPAGAVLEKIELYQRNPNVRYAEANYLRPLILPNEGSLGQGIDVIDEQWNLNNQGAALQTYVDAETGLPGWQYLRADADIDAPEAWDLEKGDASVWVAVPDSGVDCNHGDLAGKCVHEEDHVTPTVDSFGNPIPELTDQLGHGTHVAGTIAMQTDNGAGGAGVGWNTSIGAFKVCYMESLVGIAVGSSCQDADIASAITRATDLGYDVINMSFGQAAPSQVVKDALDYALAAGVVLVAAAGNNNNWQKFYPAAYADVIAVGATNAFDDRAGFSTFSVDDDLDPTTNDDDWVDVLAPGDPILSTVPTNHCSPASPQCFQWLRGTSMAAPHVSGVAALVKNYLKLNDPANANGTEIRRRIQDCADATGAMGQNMLAWSGYGRLNAAGALTCGGAAPPPEPSGPHNHVGDLDNSSTVQTGKSWVASVTVTVHDENEQPVSGAVVSASAVHNAGTEDISCTTDNTGRCAMSLTLHKKNDTVTYTITGIGSLYLAQVNHDPDGDSDGTLMVVTKP